MSEALIRLRMYDPPILTTQEFEEMEREVTTLIVADPENILVRILGRVVIDNKSRYVWAKEQNEPIPE